MKTRSGEFDLLIEIWSDVVCPWCYIGKRNLEVALAGFDGDIEIKHRAFQLDPRANVTRSSFDALGEKYGVTQVDAMLERVSKVAAEAGLAFRLKETMTGNTLDAHRLLLWAQSRGDAQSLLAAMYKAYFEDAKPLFTASDLLAVAVSIGYQPDDVMALLGGDSFANEVETDQVAAARLGANGVPFFVIDSRYGISGAQPIETFARALAKATS